MKSVLSTALAAVVSFGLAACAPAIQWSVRDADSSEVSERAGHLNKRYAKQLASLADSLNEKKIPFAAKQLDRDNWQYFNYLSFEEFKSEPVLTVHTVGKYIYNSGVTSKVARAAHCFSDWSPKILMTMDSVGLLSSSDDYKSVKISVYYTPSEAMSVDAIGEALGVQGNLEQADFILPIALAKKYANQDLAVQDLLAQAIVLIDGERNIIKTDDKAL